MSTLIISCLVLAPVVYGLIVMWPRRIPPHRTTSALRRSLQHTPPNHE